jgi:hypothetical protein
MKGVGGSGGDGTRGGRGGGCRKKNTPQSVRNIAVGSRARTRPCLTPLAGTGVGALVMTMVPEWVEHIGRVYAFLHSAKSDRPPSRCTLNPTQACVNPSQTCVNPSQACVTPTQRRVLT